MGRAHVHTMRAFTGGQARETRTVELDAATVRRDVTLLRRSEIDITVLLVDAFNRTHFPLAVGDLLQEFPVGGVVIEVLPTAALTGPDERAVLQPDRLLVDANPSLRSLVNDVRRLPIASVGEVDVQKRLLA